MSDIQALEARIAHLEFELARISAKVEGKAPGKSWVDSISGRFADCPEWDEVLRLGKEWRDSQQINYDDEESQ